MESVIYLFWPGYMVPLILMGLELRVMQGKFPNFPPRGVSTDFCPHQDNEIARFRKINKPVVIGALHIVAIMFPPTKDTWPRERICSRISA